MVAVGAAAGVAAVRLPLPEDLAAPSAIGAVAVAQREFSDERAVEVAADFGPSRSLVAATSGMVTAVRCSAGMEVASGASPFSIDGLPVLALATKVPLWRELYPGDRGDDVRALEEVLAGLGAELTVDDRFTYSTLGAFRELITEAGGSTKRVASVGPSNAAWLPAASMPVTGCPVALGHAVAIGDVLVELSSSLLGARVVSMPAGLVPGQRKLIVDGDQEFVVDEGGAIADEDLDRYAAMPVIELMQRVDEAQAIPAKLVLTDAVPAFPVPPRAIVDLGNGFCVVDGQGAVISVEVLASELGEAYVRPLDSSLSLSEIVLDPPRETPCD